MRELIVGFLGLGFTTGKRRAALLLEVLVELVQVIIDGQGPRQPRSTGVQAVKLPPALRSAHSFSVELAPPPNLKAELQAY